MNEITLKNPLIDPEELTSEVVTEFSGESFFKKNKIYDGEASSFESFHEEGNSDQYENVDVREGNEINRKDIEHNSFNEYENENENENQEDEIAKGSSQQNLQLSTTGSKIYLTLKGQKQGQLKGSVMQKGKEGAIAVLKFSHEVISPRDVATGQATGKRSHKPLEIIKEIDMASPSLMNALVTNEMLTQVVINFLQQGRTGVEINYYRITLTNASISDISQGILNNFDPVALKFPVLEKIKFTYQKIEWTWLDKIQKSASDDWNAVAN